MAKLETVTTIGELREFLKGLPDDTPIGYEDCDMMLEIVDEGNGPYVEVS